MKYRLITSTDETTFQIGVQIALSEGYRFHGDLQVIQAASGFTRYVREMVLDPDADD